MSWKKQQASLNRLWASLILEELTRHGVEHICIAPGSRSTPLTIAASEHQQLTIHTHFDERGLAFFALGMAKVHQAPVAIIVTSGTAVANLLPAVAESGLTKEKLVLLTSDRPLDLIECGANQAIRQQGIFSSHVSGALNLPNPTTTISPGWLLSSIDQLMFAQFRSGGAVQINCPYPEPLYGHDGDFSEYLAELVSWQHSTEVYSRKTRSDPAVAVLAQWPQLSNKKGLIVAGNLSLAELKTVRELARTLNWPLLLDPQTGGTSDWAHYDLWLQNADCRQQLAQAEVLVQFGARLVSKRLGQFIAAQRWQHYWLIASHPGMLDPAHQAHTHFDCPIGLWAEVYQSWLVRQSPHFPDLPPSGWANDLITSSERVKAWWAASTGHGDRLTELSFASALARCITDDCCLFIGNSLTIRLIDMVSPLPDIAVYANRGASGIDGLIASAAGVQKATKSPMLCLLGDISLLHDLNSLPLFSRPGAPCVIVVINNDGGAIFDLLAVPDKQKQDLYQMPHGFEFSHAAAMFDLDYLQPQTLPAAIHAIRNGLTSDVNRTLLVELTIPAGQAGSELNDLFSAVKNASLL